MVCCKHVIIVELIVIVVYVISYRCAALHDECASPFPPYILCKAIWAPLDAFSFCL